MYEAAFGARYWTPVLDRVMSRIARDAVAALEIHVYLASGSATRFIQPDREMAERLVWQIDPQHIFTESQILLASGGSLTSFPVAAVEQIVLLMEDPPNWPLPPGIGEVVELATDGLELEDLTAFGRHRTENFALSPTDCYGEFELRSGRIIRLRIAPAQGNESGTNIPFDLSLAAARLLDRSALIGRREEGGVFLINPTNVVRFTTYSASDPEAASLYPSNYYCG